jgi:hypothetical protein
MIMTERDTLVSAIGAERRKIHHALKNIGYHAYVIKFLVHENSRPGLYIEAQELTREEREAAGLD